MNKNPGSDKKQNIIEAAFKILNRKNYYRSPVDEIAKKAGVAKGTVYLYFKNKEEIYFAVFFRMLENIKKIADEVQKKEILPTEQMYSLLVELSTFIGENRNIFLALRENMKPIKGEIHTELHKKFDEVIGSIGRIVENGVKKKEFRKYPPELVSAVFMSLTSVIAHQKIEHNSKKSEIAPKMIFDILMNGICRVR